MKKTAIPIFVLFAAFSVVLLLLHENGFLHPQVQQVNKSGEDPTWTENESVVLQQNVDIILYDEDIPQSQTETMQAGVTEPEEEDVFFPLQIQALEDPALREISEKYHAVGVQCAVIEDGFVTGSYVYGYADRERGKQVSQETKYRVASLSKLVTNMVFMKLADDGLVSPDADISDYYGFTVRNPSYSQVAITPRMLMTHTASVIDGDAFERSLATYSEIPIRKVLQDSSVYSSAEPGTHHSYSNFSNSLIGSVSELASGKCFETLVHEFFLDPMDIDGGYLASSIENTDEIGLLYGGTSTLQSQLWAEFDPALGQTIHLVQGNLTISAVDYARLLCLLLNGGLTADGTRILSQQSVDEMLSVQFETSGYGVGLGSFIYQDAAVSGRTLYCHTGSAYGMYSCYAVDPVSKDGVVVLTSGADYAVDSRTQIYRICLDFIRLLLPA